MAASSNPLAPDPETDIDGADVFPPLEPNGEDLGSAVPVGEEGNVEFEPEVKDSHDKYAN